MSAGDIVVLVFAVASGVVIVRILLPLYRMEREMRDLEAEFARAEAEFLTEVRDRYAQTGLLLRGAPPEVSRHPETGLPCSPPSPRAGDSRLDVLRLEGEPSAIIEALTAPTPTRRPDTPTRRDP